MKYYFTLFSRSVAVVLIFCVFSGVVNAGSSKELSSAISSVSKTNSSPNTHQSQSKNESDVSSKNQSLISNVSSFIRQSVSAESTLMPNAVQQGEYIPAPFALSINKNIDGNKYNTIVSQLRNAYNKVPVQKNDSIIEKRFPFSRPITISSPVSRKSLVYWFGGITKGGNDISGFYPMNMRNNTATSTDMQTWNYSSIGATNLSPGDPWKSRYSGAGAYFQGKMYMVSGWNATLGGCAPDVWSSVNGTGWNLSQTIPAWAEGPFGGRLGHQLVVMGTKMFLIGGRSCVTNEGLGDVWVTGDGENWTQLTSNNPILGPRFDHTAVVLNNKIYVMGGFKICDNSQGTCGYKNDVISSVDGVNWVVENEHAPWLRRSGHMSFVSGTKMYVLGGQSYTVPELGASSNIWIDPSVPDITITNPAGETYSPAHGFYNDVWSSNDGIHWTQETSQAEWIWRRDAAGFVMGSTQYVFGGASEQTYTGFRNDVWKSTDGGSHWQQVSMGPEVHPVVVDHTTIVVPKNFGLGIAGFKPAVQVLRTGPLAAIGAARLRGYVTSSILNADSWFQFGQGNWQLTPYNISETIHQIVSQGTNTLVQDTVVFPESSTSYATRIVAKNNIGTVTSSGMNFTVPQCSSGLPYIWVMSPIGDEIISGFGGETFYQNQSMNVTWNSCNLPANAQITIQMQRQGSPDNFYFYSTNDGFETIQLTINNPTIWTGNYKIFVSASGVDSSQTGIFHVLQ